MSSSSSSSSEEPPLKKICHHLGKNVEEIDYYHSPYKKFYMDQHVSRFVLKNMGSYPEIEFMNVLQALIDRAYHNSKKEGRTPKMFGMLLFGNGLDTPICIPARSFEQNSVEAITNEIDMLEIR